MANPPRTGRQQINDNLLAGTQGVAAFSQYVAFGMSPKDAAVTAAKDAALQRLLGPTALVGGALTGILRTMRQIVEQSGILERGMQRISSMQQLEGKFQTMLKDIDLARRRMGELYKFAARSPFDVQSVMRANLVLQALTKGSMATARGMQLVGDVAAATGEEIDSVAVKFGKLYNGLRSGRSLDKVLFQLQAVGAISDELADQLEDLGASGASFSDKWAAVEKAFDHTRGGMANEMGSLNALQTKLENVSGAMEQAFGESFVDAQAKSIKATIAATENLTPLLRQIGSDMAPFLTFTRSLKDELVVDTLATKGMASAMMGLWTAMKAGMGAAAVGTVATGLANILPAIRQIQRHGRLRRDAYTAAGKLGQGQGLMDKGLASWERAKGAWGDRALADAAGLAVEAAALRTVGFLWKNHEAAAATATAGTEKFSLVSYAASFALNTLGAGLEKVAPLIKRFASGLASAVGHTFSLKTVTGWAAWAGAAAVAGYAWYETLQKIEKKYSDLGDEITATTVKIRDQLAAVRDLDQWREALAKTADDIGGLRQRRLELQKEENTATMSSLQFLWEQVTGEWGKRRGTMALLDNQINLAYSRAADARKRVGTTGWSGEERDYYRQKMRDDLALEDARFQGRLGQADDRTKARLLAERAKVLQDRADQGDTIAQSSLAFERTPEGKRVAELAAAESRAKADAEEQRAAFLDLLGKLNIQGLDTKGITADLEGFAELRKRLIALQGASPKAAELIGNGSTWGMAKGVLQLGKREALEGITMKDFEAKAGKAAEHDATASSAAKESLDIRANQAKSELVRVAARISQLSGEKPLTDPQKAELNRLQTRKEELILLKENASANRAAADQITKNLLPEAQLAAARRDRALDIAREEAAAARRGDLTGALSAQNRRGELVDQIAELKNLPERAQELQDVKNQLAQLDADQSQYRVGKAVDRYRISLNALGARGIEDALTLRSMRDEYAANGLSPGQAQSDLTAGWLAEARNQRPTIIADSMQSIGGGGGFSTTEPLVQVQNRIEELLNRSVELQQLIARNTRDSGRME